MSKSRKRILMVEDDVDVSRLNTEELRHASRIGLASDRGFGYVPGYPPPLEGNENKIY